jgi:hypothetical protein
MCFKNMREWVHMPRNNFIISNQYESKIVQLENENNNDNHEDEETVN